MTVQTFINSAKLPESIKAGETLKGVQLSPVGDFPYGSDCTEHVTAEAINAMIKEWQDRGSPEILCDFEHGSDRAGGSTEAAAWITNLAFDEDKGLVGDFTFTDKGADAVSSRRYRYLSPVWKYTVNEWNGKPEKSTPKIATPTSFVRCALTNTPNLPVAPLLNKAPSPDLQTVEEMKEKPMNKIAEALGLAPDATEEDILAALADLVKARDELAKDKAEAEAEAFAEENKTKCNKEVLKAQYLANKEATIALVNAIPAPAPAKVEQTVLANKATPPACPERKFANAREELASLPPSKRAEFYAAHKDEIDVK